MVTGIDKDGFDRKIESTYEKLEGLLKRVSGSGEEAAIAAEALEELATTLEELHVASDELSRQNSELAAAQLAAQAERQRYQDLFDFAPDGYLVTDTNGVIREANRAAAELLHVPQARLDGKPLAVYVADADRKAFRDILSTLLKRAITGANEWEIGLKARTGKELRASITVSPVIPLSETQLPTGKRKSDGVGLRWSLRDISESKRAGERERLLEESRQANRLLETLLDTMPVGVVMCDPDGTIKMINSPGQAILGGTATGNAHAPERDFELLFPDGRPVPADETLMVRALEGKETVQNMELLIRRADGSQRYLLAGSSPVLDGNGQVAAGVSIFQDISGLKQAEEQVQSLARFPSENPNPVLRVSAEGVLLYANEASQPLLDEWQAGVGHPLPEFWQTILADAKNEKEQVDLKNSDKIFSFMVSPVPEAGYINLYGQDISERRQAELEAQSLLSTVQEEKDRLIALVNNITDEVWFADTNKKFTLANPAALREFGMQSTDALDVEKFAASLEVFRPDGSPRPVDEAPPLRALRGESVKNQEEILRLPTSGQMRLREVNASPVKNQDGLIIGSISVVRDITERRQAEQALRKSEERYRNLFTTMDEGFCIIEMIFDTQQQPVDYRFLEVNPAFEKQTGLHEAQGKLMSALAPEHELRRFEIYGKIAMTGEPAHFINEARQLQRWFEVYAYRIGKAEERRVAIIYNDISERKLAEAKLKVSNDELRRFNQAMIGRELRMLELKQEVDELCKRAGMPARYRKDNGPQKT